MHTPGKTNPADPASRRPDFVVDSLPAALVLFESVKGCPVDAIQITDDGLQFDLTYAAPSQETLDLLRTSYHSDEDVVKALGNHKASELRLVNNVWWYKD